MTWPRLVVPTATDGPLAEPEGAEVVEDFEVDP